MKIVLKAVSLVMPMNSFGAGPKTTSWFAAQVLVNDDTPGSMQRSAMVVPVKVVVNSNAKTLAGRVILRTSPPVCWRRVVPETVKVSVVVPLLRNAKNLTSVAVSSYSELPLREPELPPNVSSEELVHPARVTALLYWAFPVVPL